MGTEHLCCCRFGEKAVCKHVLAMRQKNHELSALLVSTLQAAAYIVNSKMWKLCGWIADEVGNDLGSKLEKKNKYIEARLATTDIEMVSRMTHNYGTAKLAVHL